MIHQIIANYLYIISLSLGSPTVKDNEYKKEFYLLFYIIFTNLIPINEQFLHIFNLNLQQCSLNLVCKGFWGRWQSNKNSFFKKYRSSSLFLLQQTLPVKTSRDQVRKVWVKNKMCLKEIPICSLFCLNIVKNPCK